MTQEEFLQGKPFSVEGLFEKAQASFNGNNLSVFFTKPTSAVEMIRPAFILSTNYGFRIFAPVFGINQSVDIAFDYCNLL